MLQDERRRQPRLKSLKGARAILNRGYTTFDCVVRNLSPLGAKITLGTTSDMPSRFELRFEDGTIHHCEVRWRNPKEMGVAFSDAPAA